MRILLFKDSTIEIDLVGVCDGINSLDTSVRCATGKSGFAITTRRVSHPQTYERLSAMLESEAMSADLAVCCTSTPYDNNFFFEFSGPVAIASFSSWEHLTSLPVENGLVYFISTFVMDRLPGERSHE